MADADLELLGSAEEFYALIFDSLIADSEVQISRFLAKLPQGVDEQALRELMTARFEAETNSFLKSAGNEAETTVGRLSHDAEMDEYGDEEFMFVSILAPTSCDGCVEAHGTTGTLAELEEMGITIPPLWTPHGDYGVETYSSLVPTGAIRNLDDVTRSKLNL